MKLEVFKFHAMGGPAQVRFYANSRSIAQKWADGAIAEINRLEQKYSRYRADSVASEINAKAHQGIELDEETTLLLNYANQLFDQSDRLFDITSGILRQVWDFKSGVLPQQKQINAILPLIGWQKVTWNPPFLQFPVANMQIDFGGYVKEYAADAAAKICRQMGAESGLVDLAGDISIVGSTPDNKGWPIGISNPKNPATALSRLNLRAGGLASSGDYERSIVVSGKRYSHILNPLSGWPVDTFAGVSVVADACLLAGSLSTVAMLKGEQLGRAWLEEMAMPFCCISHSDEVHASDEFSLS